VRRHDVLVTIAQSHPLHQTDTAPEGENGIGAGNAGGEREQPDQRLTRDPQKAERGRGALAQEAPRYDV